MILPFFLLQNRYLDLKAKLSQTDRQSAENCINIQKNNDSRRKTLLRNLDISVDIFKEDFNIELGIGKRLEINYFSKNLTRITTLRYDLHDKIIAQQFNFHFLLTKNLKFQDFFPYEVYCFIDNKFGYLTYKNKVKDNYLSFLENISQQEKKKIIFKVIKLFKVLELNEAIFIRKPIFLINFSSEKEIIFDLQGLESIYQTGKEGYLLYRNHIKETNSAKSFDIFKGEYGEEFVVQKIENKSNIKVFLRILFTLWSKNLNKQNKGLDIFSYKILTCLDSDIQIDYTWDNVEEFVDTFGEKGLINETINFFLENKYLKYKLSLLKLF